MLDPYGRRIEVSLSIGLDILIVWPEVPFINVSGKLASKIGEGNVIKYEATGNQFCLC